MRSDEVLAIHMQLVKMFYRLGDPITPAGPRPGGLLESAAARPHTAHGDTEKYTTVERKAGALFHSLIANHPFHNGNKRTAIVAMLAFLDRNDRRINATDDEVFEFVLAVANRLAPFDGKPDSVVDEAAKWIRDHSSPGRTKPTGMRTGDFLKKCELAGAAYRRSKQGESWIVRGPNSKSISISGSTRRLDGTVVRTFLQRLGLSEAKTGIHLDEFQNGMSPEQVLIRQFRNVLHRLAHA